MRRLLSRLRKSTGYRGASLQGRSRQVFYELLSGAFPDLVKIASPVFLVGCHRSGNTTLAEILGAHRRVLSLIEPVALWAQAYPESFIWGSDAKAHGGRLVLTPADCELSKTARLQQLLWSRLRAARRERLVDQNPYYSFRIGFIRAMFPEARFLHIIRNGVEVARSIEGRSLDGRLWARWPGVWELFEDHARRSEGDRALLHLCASDFARGLLFWKMTIETARASASASLPPQQYYEVRYEDLLQEPKQTCRQVVDFIGEQPDASMEAFAARRVRDRLVSSGEYPPQTDALAGGLLRELGYR